MEALGKLFQEDGTSAHVSSVVRIEGGRERDGERAFRVKETVKRANA